MNAATETRLDAYNKASHYLNAVYPKCITHDPSIRSISNFIHRFNDEFYQRARNTDSREYKELKDYWNYDQEGMDLIIDFQFWIEFFRSTIAHARLISLQR